MIIKGLFLPLRHRRAPARSRNTKSLPKIANKLKLSRKHIVKGYYSKATMRYSKKSENLMTVLDSFHNSEPYVLVEGPRWADAEFYGKWLLAAAKANALVQEAMKDSCFMEQIHRLTVIYIPEFSIIGTVLLSRLYKNLVSFVVELNEEDEGAVFAMMVQMGFFVRTGERYQMVIPTRLNVKKVKTAMLKLLQTEDDQYYLHPEYLVATMPYTQTKEWEARLLQMNQDHRCADRNLLLS
jgi:hypothetical protein